jgi:hypothetical protein
VVAAKFANPDVTAKEKQFQTLYTEYLISQKLEHPNIVKVLQWSDCMYGSDPAV